MPERTINKVKRGDIGVVCEVMDRAVARLPAEEETPPFRRKKRAEPLCYFNSKFMNSPPCVLLSVGVLIISIPICSNIQNAGKQSDRAPTR